MKKLLPVILALTFSFSSFAALKPYPGDDGQNAQTRAELRRKIEQNKEENKKRKAEIKQNREEIKRDRARLKELRGKKVGIDQDDGQQYDKKLLPAEALQKDNFSAQEK